MVTIEQFKQFTFQRIVTPIWLMGTLTLSILYLDTRYNIAFPEQEMKCLPYSIFIIDTFDKTVKREGLFAFKNRGWTEPYEDNQWTVIKIAAGVPGDVVSIGRDMTQVGEDTYRGLEQAVADKLKKPIDSFERTETIPEHHYFAVGTLERTYDSRYWGFVSEDQVVGRAYGIL